MVSDFLKSREAEFMQYRSPVGWGPSSNTWPRCASHLLHRTSTLRMKKEESVSVVIEFGSVDWKKLGQPVPESNFAMEEKRGSSQQTQ